MASNVNKKDLRVTKTYGALIGAFSALLGNRKFGQLTVNALCKEAKVSRAAFYAHFSDKYALLEYWFTQVVAELMDGIGIYANAEMAFNQFFCRNGKIFTNLLNDADCETIEVLCECMLSNLYKDAANNEDGAINRKHAALSSFYVGGTIYYLLWQVKNRFPTDVQIMNPEFYEISQLLLRWGTDQKQS